MSGRRSPSTEGFGPPSTSSIESGDFVNQGFDYLEGPYDQRYRERPPARDIRRSSSSPRVRHTGGLSPLQRRLRDDEDAARASWRPIDRPLTTTGRTPVPEEMESVPPRRNRRPEHRRFESFSPPGSRSPPPRGRPWLTEHDTPPRRSSPHRNYSRTPSRSPYRMLGERRTHRNRSPSDSSGLSDYETRPNWHRNYSRTPPIERDFGRPIDATRRNTSPTDSDLSDDEYWQRGRAGRRR